MNGCIIDCDMPRANFAAMISKHTRNAPGKWQCVAEAADNRNDAEVDPTHDNTYQTCFDTNTHTLQVMANSPLSGNTQHKKALSLENSISTAQACNTGTQNAATLLAKTKRSTTTVMIDSSWCKTMSHLAREDTLQV